MGGLAFMELPKIGCAILAAGNSTRFHSNKLTASFHGEPVYLRLFKTLPIDCFSQITVVTQEGEIAQSARVFGYQVVINPHPENGISGSVRLGTESCISCDAIAFLVADQPLLTTQTIRTLVHNYYEHPDNIIGAVSSGRRGNPNIFPKLFFDELCRITGDKGGGVVIRNHPDSFWGIDVPELELEDIDTVESFLSLQNSIFKE